MLGPGMPAINRTFMLLGLAFDVLLIGLLNALLLRLMELPLLADNEERVGPR
jgi:hypothetical protein